MKILHVWNTAGVASVIAKFMDREFGTRSLVVMRAKFDKFGLTTYGEVWNVGGRVFAAKAVLLARKFDLVHVHDLDRVVPWLKLLYPGKPVIITYHGSDAIMSWERRKPRWERADGVTVSTENLLENAPKNVTWMPNPVDSELFHPGSGTPRAHAALTLSYDADDEARLLAERYGVPLVVRDKESDPVRHSEMPHFLSAYEYYVDVKRGLNLYRGVLRSLSKTGLEALACGVKVVRWDGELVAEFPERHRPENVAANYYALYTSVLGRGSAKTP